MESKTLILNTSFPTLNQYIAANNRNRYASNAMKQTHTNKVMLLAKSAKFELVKGQRYDVACHWYKPNNRTDHDNISFGIKFLLDGIVKAGILKDDSPKFINSIHHHFELDRTRDYISCSVMFIPSLISG